MQAQYISRILNTAYIYTAGEDRPNLASVLITSDGHTLTVSATDGYGAIVITTPNGATINRAHIGNDDVVKIAKMATDHAKQHKGYDAPPATLTFTETTWTYQAGTTTTEGQQAYLTFPDLAPIYAMRDGMTPQLPARYDANYLARIGKAASTLTGKTGKNTLPPTVDLIHAHTQKPAHFTITTHDGISAEIVQMPQRIN